MPEPQMQTPERRDRAQLAKQELLVPSAWLRQSTGPCQRTWQAFCTIITFFYRSLAQPQSLPIQLLPKNAHQHCKRNASLSVSQIQLQADFIFPLVAVPLLPLFPKLWRCGGAECCEGASVRARARLRYGCACLRTWPAVEASMFTNTSARPKPSPSLCCLVQLVPHFSPPYVPRVCVPVCRCAAGRKAQSSSHTPAEVVVVPLMTRSDNKLPR